jgi:hypothetical protein
MTPGLKSVVYRTLKGLDLRTTYSLACVLWVKLFISRESRYIEQVFKSPHQLRSQLFLQLGKGARCIQSPRPSFVCTLGIHLQTYYNPVPATLNLPQSTNPFLNASK